MKRAMPISSAERPRITSARSETEHLIDAQIAAGEALTVTQCKSAADVVELSEKVSRWEDFTQELLRKLFTTEELAKEFRGFSFGTDDANPARHLEKIQRELGWRMSSLKSIRGKLELYDELAPPSSYVARKVPISRNVFVVHGRDEAAKSSVARFLEKLDLIPIILHEQADRGRTIIQKFEDHSEVGFAVILLTPDDEGGLKGSPDLKPRARQNVVFELGYFRGKLGRARVCALMVDSVEEPSDLHGVLYVPLDVGGVWMLTLARELKAAGIDVDLNKAI